mmetsp:Transcript_22781/g.50143  ORF Transcript_22781/g.50143 Transcript_22781/m.50143 type:complete len:243 (-) Transcript_22781:1366-2094(-)
MHSCAACCCVATVDDDALSIGLCCRFCCCGWSGCGCDYDGFDFDFDFDFDGWVRIDYSNNRLTVSAESRSSRRTSLHANHLCSHQCPVCDCHCWGCHVQTHPYPLPNTAARMRRTAGVAADAADSGGPAGTIGTDATAAAAAAAVSWEVMIMSPDSFCFCSSAATVAVGEEGVDADVGARAAAVLGTDWHPAVDEEGAVDRAVEASALASAATFGASEGMATATRADARAFTVEFREPGASS